MRFRQNTHTAACDLVSGKLEQLYAHRAPKKAVQTECRGRKRESAPPVSACLYRDLLERLVEIADRTGRRCPRANPIGLDQTRVCLALRRLNLLTPYQLGFFV